MKNVLHHVSIARGSLHGGQGESLVPPFTQLSWCLLIHAKASSFHHAFVSSTASGHSQQGFQTLSMCTAPPWPAI